MNQWELKRKYTLDSVSAMIDYAESISEDHESKSFQDALWDWVKNHEQEFKDNWEKEFGKLEDKTCQMKITK